MELIYKDVVSAQRFIREFDDPELISRHLQICARRLQLHSGLGPELEETPPPATGCVWPEGDRPGMGNGWPYGVWEARPRQGLDATTVRELAGGGCRAFSDLMSYRPQAIEEVIGAWMGKAGRYRAVREAARRPSPRTVELHGPLMSAARLTL